MSQSQPSGPMRVLVVDDDDEFAEMTAAFLRRDHEDWSIETATSAAEGLDRLDKDGGYDCIVSDYDMPGTDGLEFLEAATEFDPDLPFILFTGKGSEEIASRAISAGVTDYLQKTGRSGQYERLANRIAQAVRTRRAERAAQETQAHLEALIETATVVILTIDESSTIQFVSEAVESVFGYHPEELEGESLTTLMPPRFRERHLEGIERYLATDERQFDWDLIEFPGRHRDGHEIPLSISFSEFSLDGEHHFTGIIRDRSEREERERAIEVARERLDLFTNEIEEYAIFRLDPDGTVVSWNAGAERIKGYEEAAIVGQHFSTFYPEADREAGRPAQLLEEAAAEGRVVDEGWRIRSDGSRFWALVTITALYDDDGALQGYAKVTRDMTDRKRYEDRLAGLNELLASFLQIDEPTALCETATDAAGALELPLTAVALYDEESGALQPTATTRPAQAELDMASLLDGGVAWEAFTAGASRVVDGPDAMADDSPSQRQLAIHPLGRHGVFLTVVEGPGPVPPEVEDVVEAVARGLHSALDRLDREASLRERETQLEAQTERLIQLNQLNDVIRGIDRALVAATTREAVERMVCEALVTEGPYRFAWLGEYDAVTGHVEPREWAGDGQGYLKAVTVDVDQAGNPTFQAADTRDPAMLSDMLGEPPLEPWRAAALEREFRSCIAVPVGFRDRLYGVLTVYADRPGAFDELSHGVLAELGGTIGLAINSIENRRALVRDEVVELEFEMSPDGSPFLEAVARIPQTTFELEGVVPDDGGGYRVFFTLQDAPTDIGEHLEASPVVESWTLIAAREVARLYECRLTDDSLIAWLVNHAAVPRAISVDGEAHLTIAVPDGTDVREFVGLFQAAFEGAELVARRDRERPVRTRTSFRADLEEQLTPRQLEVLQTAYFSGFFDSPRERTGQQIAASLDITQPTFSGHLRAGLRKVLGSVLDDDRPDQ